MQLVDHASTFVTTHCRVSTHIRPLIGSKQVRDLRLGDIQGMQPDIVVGETPIQRVYLAHYDRPSRGLRRLASMSRLCRLSESEVLRWRSGEQGRGRRRSSAGLSAIRLMLV